METLAPRSEKVNSDPLLTREFSLIIYFSLILNIKRYSNYYRGPTLTEGGGKSRTF